MKGFFIMKRLNNGLAFEDFTAGCKCKITVYGNGMEIGNYTGEIESFDYDGKQLYLSFSDGRSSLFFNPCTIKVEAFPTNSDLAKYLYK